MKTVGSPSYQVVSTGSPKVGRWRSSTSKPKTENHPASKFQITIVQKSYYSLYIHFMVIKFLITATQVFGFKDIFEYGLLWAIGDPG